MWCKTGRLRCCKTVSLNENTVSKDISVRQWQNILQQNNVCVALQSWFVTGLQNGKKTTAFYKKAFKISWWNSLLHHNFLLEMGLLIQCSSVHKIKWGIGAPGSCALPPYEREYLYVSTRISVLIYLINFNIIYRTWVICFNYLILVIPL